jgi:hypothetical protein
MRGNCQKINLEELGFSEIFKSNADEHAQAGLEPVRVIAEHKELYIVRTADSTLVMFLDFIY